jgi:hypothetical protein
MEKKNEQRAFCDATFEQACAGLKINNMLPDVSFLPSRNQAAILAFYKLSVIVQWINKGWDPDWSNYDQLKWFPWFWVETGAHAGLRNAYSYYAPSRAYATFGARLCYKTEALVEEWAEKLLPLYNDMLLIDSKTEKA